MRLHLGLLLVLAFPLAIEADEATEPTVEILRLEPTVFFPHGEPPMQVARLTLANRTGKPIDIQVRSSVAELDAPLESLGELPPGETTREILVPDIAVAGKLRVELLSIEGQTVAAHETAWQPQRHWVIYIVKSAHTDLGYEKSEFIKREELARYIDDARQITDDTWELADPSRYRWTIEHLFWLRGCLDVRPWPWYRRLVDDYIKPGKMAVTAPVCGVHTHWHGLEQLCRSMYWGRRRVGDRLGLDLPLYYIVDNPSVAWPVAQAWAQAGGRYVTDCRQGWRTGGKDAFRHTGVPRVFWWVGPDGKSKVLFTYPASYGLFRSILQSGYEGMLTKVPNFLRSIEDGTYGPYPYELVLAPAYADHSPPREDESAGVVRWNEHWRYPELRIDDPTRFMAEMERRYGDQIPTLAGDMSNYSADYAAIDSNTFGLKRAAGLRLSVADGLASIARVLDPQYALSQRTIADAYWRLSEYDDHTWPTGPAPDDFNETNFGLFKTHNARLVADAAESEIGRALDAITSMLSCPGPAIVVFNPLAHPRTDVVTVPLAKLPKGTDGLALVDSSTGKAAFWQIAGDELVLLAHDVPSFGYKTYSLERGPAPPPSDELKAADGTLENRFYRVTFDETTGTIASLFDKELGRELVDSSAPHRLNQFIYDHRAGRTSTAGYQASPGEARVAVDQVGPVFARMRVETVEPKSGAEIRQLVTVYRNLKRVEIANELRKVRAMWGDERTFERQWGRVGPRYKENVFIAFPLDVPDATIRAEYAIGTVRPYHDQLRLGSHDFLSVQRYVDASNRDYGVTWTTREAPVVHFGEIRYNQFSNTYKPQRPWLYSYAMSNRLAGLVWHHPDQCRADLHYTITSHAGSWPEGTAARYGWERGNPLVAAVIEESQEGSLPAEQTFVEIDAANVEMAVLKPSEPPGRGFVIRMVETESRPNTPVHVRVPMLRLARAVACDLVENDGRSLPLDADGRGFRLQMGRHALATIRLVPQAETPQKVTGLRAEAVSDKAIRLAWPAVEGATSYRVYRLPGPGEAVCLDHLVGETSRNEYLDDWLNLDTTYRYRVAAVAPGNLEGEAGDEAGVRTRSENVSPPSPVRELVALERSCRRVILTWRTSKEPDVVAYHIYRCETPDFKLDDGRRIEVVGKPEPYYRQFYIDTKVEPRKTYFYRVLAVDEKGRRSPSSPVATLTLCDDPGPPQPEPDAKKGT